jgi:hypothetical protein
MFGSKTHKIHPGTLSPKKLIKMQVILNQINQAKTVNPDNLMAKHFEMASFHN